MCLAVPGKIVSICDRPNVVNDATEDVTLWRTGKVSFGGVIKEVSLAYVPEAQVDDYVIVHVGFALSIVDQAEAEETLNYLEHMEIA